MAEGIILWKASDGHMYIGLAEHKMHAPFIGKYIVDHSNRGKDLFLGEHGSLNTDPSNADLLVSTPE